MIKTKISSTIKRKCIVCGKKVIIKLYKDGHYIGGHYFGKPKIPIGKGKYKKVGTTKIGRNKIDIVNWTGKKIKLEYWECNNCFDEAKFKCWLEEIIEKLYGNRKKKHKAWEFYEDIRKHLRKKY